MTGIRDKPHETEKGCPARNAGPGGPENPRFVARGVEHSENNRRAPFYWLTRAAIIARFFEVKAQDSA
jgi:hypothetical protein